MNAGSPDRSWVMTNHQKSVVMKLLEKHGAPPGEFSWSEVPSSFSSNNGQMVSVVQHNTNKEIICIFDRNRADVHLLFTPAQYERIGTIEFKWQYLETYAAPWAQYAARELEASDYLESVVDGAKFVQLELSSNDGTKFDEVEKEELRVVLSRVEQRLLSLNSDVSDYHAEVRAQIDFLVSQLDRSDRRAYYYCVFGTLASIGMTYLGTDGTRAILRFAAEQMGHIMQLLPTSV
jgi:hypothetical protein